MSDNKNQYIEALAKLLELTQKNRLEWNIVPTANALRDISVGSVYEAEYKEKKLRLYTKKNPFKVGGLLGVANKGYDVVLEIADRFGNPAWQFPDELITIDLYKAVKFKASGAQDLIDDLLKDS